MSLDLDRQQDSFGYPEWEGPKDDTRDPADIRWYVYMYYAVHLRKLPDNRGRVKAALFLYSCPGCENEVSAGGLICYKEAGSQPFTSALRFTPKVATRYRTQNHHSVF